MRDYYEQVRGILTEYPKARDDDMYLYAVFCARTTNVNSGDGFFNVLVHHTDYSLPSYESVTRARRKVQECEISLRGTRRTRRKDMQEEYREFYRR